MIRSAHISECGKYRYTLHRRWGDLMSRHLAFVMLNPSTADAETDDNTIRKCVMFAKREGYGRLSVVNLFAYRATDPRVLKAAAARGEDVFGPSNEGWITFAARDADRIVCAWGAPGGKLIPETLWPYRFKCSHLGLTASGSPKHPLYLAKNTPFTPMCVV